MISPEALNAKLDDMLKDTKNKRLKWRLEIETSEYEPEDKKIIIKEGNKEWLMNECYTCFSCTFHGEDFVMITYEDIETYEKETRSLTMVFLPPVAMRLFDVNTLAPYCISTNAVLTSKIHTLYETLLALYKEDKNNVTIIMDPWVPNKGIEQ